MELYKRQYLNCNYLIALADGVYGSTSVIDREAVELNIIVPSQR